MCSACGENSRMLRFTFSVGRIDKRISGYVGQAMLRTRAGDHADFMTEAAQPRRGLRQSADHAVVWGNHASVTIMIRMPGHNRIVG